MDNEIICSEVNLLQVRQAHLLTLSGELMKLLDQVKAMLKPLNEDAFFQLNESVLRNYFHGMETLVDLAVHTRDEMSQLMAPD